MLAAGRQGRVARAASVARFIIGVSQRESPFRYMWQLEVQGSSSSMYLTFPYRVKKIFTRKQQKNPYNIFVAILENRCLHKFILSLTDL